MLSQTVLRRGLTATALTGGCLAGYSVSKSEDGLKVTGRAIRLARTAVCMAVDYQIADWQWIAKSASLEEANINCEEQNYWQEEVIRRQKLLEDAQAKYTTDLHTPEESYEEVKKLEKQAMLEAANDLEEAEEILASYGRSHKSQIHQRAAERLLRLCHENGGVYIKVGQHLANLDYLIPQEYIETLSALFDDNPHTSREDVAAVIREELGADPETLFDGYDPTPIASASLAQVHVAYCKKTGRKLAVKVQHRGLAETATGDIRALAAVSRTAEQLFEGYTWGCICDEIERLVPKELDFLNEGHNSERAAEDLKATGLDCVVPKVLWEYSSPRVLTMEFEEGFKATDVEAIEKAGLCKKDVAELVSSVFASQIFLSGWVHCDPHPANVLLRPQPNGKPEIVLLDHGLYRELDPEFSRNYATLWKALMLADIPTIKESCAKLGVRDAYALFAGLVTSRPFDEIVERSKKGTLPGTMADSKADKMIMSGYAQRYIIQIFDLLSKIPRQMLLLLKTSDCLRHIDSALGSPTSTLVVSGSYAALAVYRDECDRMSSWVARIPAWLQYIGVLARIRIHEMAMQWSARPAVLS